MSTETARSPSSPSVLMLRLDIVRESPFNPRLLYDETKLAELAASVKEKGVLHPVKARPVAASGKTPFAYELVYGHRRFRAAKLAGVAAIPAIVAEMTDREVCEEQAVENHQREDVHPLEEADGFRRLADEHKVAVEEIARRIGLSKEYVYARMKLCTLCKAGRDAFVTGKLTPSTALFVARIPSTAMQEKAVAELVAQADRAGIDQPLGARPALEIIQSRFMLKLAGAPFDTADKALVAKAGACNTCPKRTGNQPDLFADIKGKDVCTDIVCYREKADAAWKLKSAALEKAGAKVVDDKTSAKTLFPYEHSPGQLSYSAKLVDVDATAYEDPKRRTYREILGGALTPDKLKVGRDRAGKIHDLVDQSAMPALLKASGFKDPTSSTSARHAPSDHERKEREKSEVKRATARAAIAQVIERATKGPEDKFLRVLVDGILAGSWHDVLSEVVARRGWTEKGTQPNDIIGRKVKGMPAPEIKGLLVEAAVTRFAFSIHQTNFGGTLDAACKSYGVDLAKLGADVRKERASRKKAKASKKPAPKAKPAKAPAKKKPAGK